MPANPQRHFPVVEITVMAALIAGAGMMLATFGFTSIEFRPFDESNVLGIIGPLFVVAVLVERLIEAILVPMRAPQRQRMEVTLRNVEMQIQRIPDAASSAPHLDDERRELTDQINVYRLETAKIAYWLSFFFGLLISLVGVRVLEGLLDISALDTTGTLNQRFYLSLVDIIVTGGLISGGSAAIDKIGRRIAVTTGLRSATDSKNKQDQQRDQGGAR